MRTWAFVSADWFMRLVHSTALSVTGWSTDSHPGHRMPPHHTTHEALRTVRSQRSERRACLCSQRSEGRKEGNEPLPILLFSLHTLGRLCSPTLRLLSLSLALRLGALLSASGPHSARPPAPAPVRSTCLFHLTERKGRRKEGREHEPPSRRGAAEATRRRRRRV